MDRNQEAGSGLITAGKNNNITSVELPLSGTQKKVAIGVVSALLLIGLTATPLAATPLPAMPGFMTAYGGAMLVANLLLAALLFSRGATERRAATIQLGTAYFFVGAIFLPLMLAFPGGLVAGSVIGVTVSPLWLWAFWHAGFGLAILRYVWTQRRASVPTRVGREVAGVLVAVAALTWLATQGLEWLPQLLSDGITFFIGAQQAIPYGILALDLLVLVCIARLPVLGTEQIWLAVGMVAACVDVWLTFSGVQRYSLGWYVSKLCSLATTLTVLVSLFHDLGALYRRVSQANALLAGVAHQDGLTGLSNRRRFDEVIAAEWSRAFRADLPMALLIIDVDLFKNYNERYGHAEGDECLRRVAALIRNCTRRAGDLTARIGGEEFAAILPDTDAAGAAVMVALLRRELSAMGLLHQESPSGMVTVSVGIALTQPSQTSAQDLLHAAEAALQSAKAAGRDQACLAPQQDGARVPAGWAEANAADAAA